MLNYCYCIILLNNNVLIKPVQSVYIYISQLSRSAPPILATFPGVHVYPGCTSAKVWVGGDSARNMPTVSKIIIKHLFNYSLYDVGTVRVVVMVRVHILWRGVFQYSLLNYSLFS